MGIGLDTSLAADDIRARGVETFHQRPLRGDSPYVGDIKFPIGFDALSLSLLPLEVVRIRQTRCLLLRFGMLCASVCHRQGEMNRNSRVRAYGYTDYYFVLHTSYTVTHGYPRPPGAEPRFILCQVGLDRYR